jgi:hypothetical protein
MLVILVCFFSFLVSLVDISYHLSVFVIIILQRSIYFNALFYLLKPVGFYDFILKMLVFLV